jgi:prolyl oligopeptidase
MPVTAYSWTPHCYPPTHRSDHIDVYQSEAHGEVKVPDPYAWLEKDGEERKRWLASQETLARKLLDSHPDRAMLEEEIRSSTDYEKVSLFDFVDIQRGSIYWSIQFGSPSLRDDGQWYWSYNSGLQPQSGLSPRP